MCTFLELFALRVDRNNNLEKFEWNWTIIFNRPTNRFDEFDRWMIFDIYDTSYRWLQPNISLFLTPMSILKKVLSVYF